MKRNSLAMLVFASLLAVAQTGSACVTETITVEDIYHLDFSKTKTVDDYCQELRLSNFCAVNCEDRVRETFDKAKAESELESAKQQEKEREAALKKQATDTREADLRAGRVKPQNFGEVAIVYNAEIGIDLASAPKVRPDGKMYALPGKIAIADDSPEFLAQISLGEQNDALFRMTGRSSEIDGSYFYVKIPKALQAYYFDQAKIERGFNMVGRYVANTKYKTIAGQQKSAPVFEAVYFVMR